MGAVDRPATFAKFCLLGIAFPYSFLRHFILHCGSCTAQRKETNSFCSRSHFGTGSRLFPLKLRFFFDSFDLCPTPSIPRARDLLVLSMETCADVHQVPRGTRNSLSVLEGRRGATSVSDTTAAARAQAELRRRTDFDTFSRSSPQIPRRLFTRSNPAQLYNRNSVEALLVQVATLSLHLRSMQMGVPRQ